MISISDKQKCCGCSACAQRCPKQCITMQEDAEGFLYPQVDADVCIDCGLCEKVCPFINPNDKREPIQTLAAINKNEVIRMQSSSGGIFSFVAEQIIDEGGVVFGARFDEKWQVILDYTETIDGLVAFRGSKYVQARVGSTYRQCLKFLNDGRKVLFSGTPCQIAGLKRYLRKDFDNLFTIDLACHGVPSPKVWKMYLDSLQKTLSINNINMRDKQNGWKKFNFRLSYSNEENSYELTSPAFDNDYMKAFLCNLILRPSCHDCKMKECRSNSDITLADYWGIENVSPEMNDNRGTSLVLLHNEKAKALLSQKNLKFRETSYEQAFIYNSAIIASVKPHINRNQFFAELDTNNDIVSLIKKHATRPQSMQTKGRIKQLPYRIARKVKHMITNVIQKKRCGGGNQQINSTLNQTTPLVTSTQKIVDVNFRDKRTKWQHYNFTIKIR